MSVPLDIQENEVSACEARGVTKAVEAAPVVATPFSLWGLTSTGARARGSRRDRSEGVESRMAVGASGNADGGAGVGDEGHAAMLAAADPARPGRWVGAGGPSHDERLSSAPTAGGVELPRPATKEAGGPHGKGQ